MLDKSIVEKLNKRGRQAYWPWQIPLSGWLDVFKRVAKRFSDDNFTVVAAGVAFFFFMALFPTLAMIFSLYGLLTEPAEVQAQLQQLFAILPAESYQVTSEILRSLSGEDTTSLSISLFISLMLSMWSASRGVSALFMGVNVAYNQRDKRNFFKRNGILLLFTFGSILLSIVCLALVLAAPEILNRFNVSTWVENLVTWLRWPALLLILMICLSLLYKWAPYRRDPRWSWASYGSVIAGLLWVVSSAGFSLYVSNFGNYDKTYGSFSAIIVLLLYLYLTAFIMVMGACINSELEHQTSRDTTIGKPRPIGQRNAYHADRVAGIEGQAVEGLSQEDLDDIKEPE